jgi:sRNA-binding protein
MLLGLQESEKDQDHRRMKTYKWYKHYAKPTKESMCSIVEYYANNIDITRQDVDLLPWNLEETAVFKKVMKALKTRMKREKKDKKQEKKDKKQEKKDKKKKDKKHKKKDQEEKEKERDVGEGTASPKSNGYSKCPTLLKGEMSDSSTSLGFSLNGSSGSLDAGSCSWNQDHTQDHHISRQLLRIKVEEEHKRKREERRLKREAAKKNVLEVDAQAKNTAEDTRSIIKEAHRNDRLERAFLWYTRMGTPTRAEYKRHIASQKVDITPEDVNLLTWNENGTGVVNITTMNAMVMTRMLKQSATQVPALR